MEVSVPAYGELTAPPHSYGTRDLTAALQWSVEAEDSFMKPNRRLSNAADLAIPDFSVPFFFGSKWCGVSEI